MSSDQRMRSRRDDDDHLSFCFALAMVSRVSTWMKVSHLRLDIGGVSLILQTDRVNSLGVMMMISSYHLTETQIDRIPKCLLQDVSLLDDVDQGRQIVFR